MEDTGIWYRKPLFDDDLGELISHDNIKDTTDERVTVEKTVFEDLVIYKLHIIDMKISDGGTYHCDTYSTSSQSRSVFVSVFDKEDYDEDKDDEDINIKADFFGYRSSNSTKNWSMERQFQNVASYTLKLDISSGATLLSMLLYNFSF